MMAKNMVQEKMSLLDCERTDRRTYLEHSTHARHMTEHNEWQVRPRRRLMFYTNDDALVH